MPAQKINTLDDYEMTLGERIEHWPPQKRLALAAAMAERWLPVYERFSREEEWGDVDSLRHCMDAVWNHLLGKPLLSASDRSRYVRMIEGVTPHMDDFDANEALAACVMLSEAVESCRMGNNIRQVIQAALSGFEAVAPDWGLDPDEQPHLWQTGPVRKELRNQLRLLEQLENLDQFNKDTVEGLREICRQPGMVGEKQPRDEAEKGGVSNQALFEQYRRIIEMDNRGKDPSGLDFKPEAIIFGALIFGEWSGRYSRRKDMIKGTYGIPADAMGMQALKAWLAERDAKVLEMPVLDKEVYWIFDLAMKNPMNGLEVDSLEKPHQYGPSLRSLWQAATQMGLSDDQLYLGVIRWARHKPEAWKIMDENKRKGLSMDPTLGERLAQRATWTRTNALDQPWKTNVNGETWTIQLGDFPDDFLYTLMINGNVIGKFHDWPETWARE